MEPGGAMLSQVVKSSAGVTERSRFARTKGIAEKDSEEGRKASDRQSKQEQFLSGLGVLEEVQ